MATLDSIDDLAKSIQSAKDRSDIKNAIQSCLTFTKSLSADQVRQQSGVWFSVGEALLRALNPSFLGVLTKHEYEELFVETFVQAPPQDSVPLLVHSLKRGPDNSLKDGYILEKILHILDAVVRKRLGALFISMCIPNPSDLHSLGGDSTGRLIQDLASIPDRAAAVIHGGRVDEKSVLNVDSYCKVVAVAIIEALKYSHHLLATGSGDCSLKFLSDLLGKFYMSGYGRKIIQILAPSLYRYCSGGTSTSDDFIWRRLSKRLFTGVHTLALDGVIADLAIVLSSRDPGKIVDLEKLLGDSVDKEEKIRYVLTNKLLLTRRFDETALVPETVFRYLANTEGRRKSILRQTLIKLLTVWSSATSVTRIGFEKHYYISRSILIACSHLTDEERREVQHDATPLILRGIGFHLSAVDDAVRKVGMVMGELLTGLFTAGKETEKLKFDYEEDEKTTYLKDLLKPRANEEFASVSDLVDPAASEEAAPMKPAASKEANYKVAAGVDSDDDEDLVPYDMPSEDEDDSSVGHSKEPLPVYIKDCLDCIVERKSFRLYEAALRSLEQLIRRNSPGADDLALEIAQVLLHAEDHYGLDKEFVKLQQSIMVACCVKQPKRVPPFLAGEFYGKNYSIQHRLLILDVLVKAARELSKPDHKTAQEDAEDVIVVVPKKEEPATPTPLVPTWRQVVQDRIEKKTRRWGSAVTGQKSKTPKTPTPNRFASVAGPCFFYPLLAEMDKPIDTLDMFGADYIVLGRLLFVTATILFEAENAPGLISMAIAHVHVVLRRTGRHEKPFVRQGSLFALIMAFMTVPSRILAAEYQDELLEAQAWLEYTRSEDPDDQCRQLADQALRLIAKKANEGLNALIEIGMQSR